MRLGWVLPFTPSPYEQGVWKRLYIENVSSIKFIGPQVRGAWVNSSVLSFHRSPENFHSPARWRFLMTLGKRNAPHSVTFLVPQETRLWCIIQMVHCCRIWVSHRNQRVLTWAVRETRCTQNDARRPDRVLRPAAESANPGVAATPTPRTCGGTTTSTMTTKRAK